MKKKKFANPFILLTAGEGGTLPGGGSLEGGLNSIGPLPMSFDEWTASRFCGDVDNSGGIDFADYASWWNSNGFGEESWLAYNPELAVTEEIPDVMDVIGDDLGGEFGG